MKLAKLQQKSTQCSALSHRASFHPPHLIPVENKAAEYCNILDDENETSWWKRELKATRLLPIEHSQREPVSEETIRISLKNRRILLYFLNRAYNFKFVDSILQRKILITNKSNELNNSQYLFNVQIITVFRIESMGRRKEQKRVAYCLSIQREPACEESIRDSLKYEDLIILSESKKRTNNLLVGNPEIKFVPYP